MKRKTVARCEILRYYFTDKEVEQIKEKLDQEKISYVTNVWGDISIRLADAGKAATIAMEI